MGYNKSIVTLLGDILENLLELVLKRLSSLITFCFFACLYLARWKKFKKRFRKHTKHGFDFAVRECYKRWYMWTYGKKIIVFLKDTKRLHVDSNNINGVGVSENLPYGEIILKKK